MPSHSPTDLLAELRARTASIHQQLEASPSSTQLTSSALTPPAYEDFIRRQYAAFQQVEFGLLSFHWPNEYHYPTRIPAFAEEKVSLPPVEISLQPSSPISLGEAIGRAYVLEGSSHGASILLKKFKANPALVHYQPFPFHRFQRMEGLSSWRDFSAFAKTIDASPELVEEACESAVQAFAAFAQAPAKG